MFCKVWGESVFLFEKSRLYPLREECCKEQIWFFEMSFYEALLWISEVLAPSLSHCLGIGEWL